MNSRLSMSLWGLTAFLSIGVGVYAYVAVPSGGAFSPYVLANLFARPWLVLHAALAGTALIIGPFQFLKSVRARRDVHRMLGKVYVICCIVSGSAGFLMSFGSTAGTVAGLGFGTLAVVWIYCTVQALRMAQLRRFDAHRRWMIRSFALTFAAVTLRLYLPFPLMMGFSFVEGYSVIAWLAWVPNLILAEAFLRREMARLQPA